MMRCGKGQSVLEYAIILAIVAAACTVMTLYIRRAVQGKLYNIEEKVTGKPESGVIIPQ